MGRVTELKDKISAKKRRLSCVLTLWSLAVFAFLLLRFLYLRFGFGIPCPLYAVTGILCPGCGTFRAIGALVQAAVWQAVRYNALAVVLLPALVLLCIRDTIRYVRAAPHVPISRPEKIFVVGVVVVSVLYAAMRNLPFFDVLRPTVL